MVRCGINNLGGASNLAPAVEVKRATQERGLLIYSFLVVGRGLLRRSATIFRRCYESK